MREGELFACAYTLRSNHRRCSTKKSFLKKFRTIYRKTDLRPQGCNSIKKATPRQLFSSEFCEFFQNTYFTEWLWTTAAVCYIGSCYFYETKVALHNLNQLQLLLRHVRSSQLSIITGSVILFDIRTNWRLNVVFDVNVIHC